MRSRAELYDWELRHVLERTDQDLEFYLDLAARSGGPVLELACGTGRITARLQAAGHDIVGLDLDADMLAAARRAGVRKLVQADMRRFSLRSRFGLVFVAYNSLQLLLDDQDRLACLRCALAHLRSGSFLALELTDFQAGDVDPWVEPELLASAGGVRLWGSLVHDTAARVTRYRRRYEADGDVLEDEVVLHSLPPGGAADLLARAGAVEIVSHEDGARATWVACAR